MYMLAYHGNVMQYMYILTYMCVCYMLLHVIYIHVYTHRELEEDESRNAMFHDQFGVNTTG